MTTHQYRLAATWTGSSGGGTTGYRDYAREVTVAADGKPDLLLSFLHVAVTHGVVVTGYVDHATGTMEQEGIGGRFTEVVLHPEASFAEPVPTGRSGTAS